MSTTVGRFSQMSDPYQVTPLPDVPQITARCCAEVDYGLQLRSNPAIDLQAFERVRTSCWAYSQC